MVSQRNIDADNAIDELIRFLKEEARAIRDNEDEHLTHQKMIDIAKMIDATLALGTVRFRKDEATRKKYETIALAANDLFANLM